MKRIAVLGAGNGGQAMAGHLASMGHSVTLFEHPDFSEKVQNLNANGNRIVLSNKISATGQLAEATCDIAKAVRGAEIIFFAAPSFAQEPILESALPFLEDGQALILIPGNFGSLVLRRLLQERGVTKKLLIGETDTLPYACRLTANGQVDIWGVKEFVLMAALPACDNQALIAKLDGVFPVRILEMPNVLAVALSNGNMVVHCATMIMNTGRIESEKGNFRFYTDGMTPAVCRVQEEVDAERLAVAAAFGLRLKSGHEKLREMYSLEGDSFYELQSKCAVYGQHGNDAPKSMDHRYLGEDVPHLLVPLSELGRLGGVTTPAVDSVIYLAGVVNGVDYRVLGRSLERLGLARLDRDALIKALSL